MGTKWNFDVVKYSGVEVTKLAMALKESAEALVK
jgi:hypothetical protein